MGEERKIVFVSYWTSKYKDAAARLQESLNKLGLHTDIQEVPDKGWKMNVRHKPTFILDMLKKHNDAYAVVWIDADGDVLKKPELFWEIEEDIGARFLLWRHKNKEELLSGTFYSRNSEKVRTAFGAWILRLANAPMTLSTPEQSVLHNMLPELKLSVKRLPENYCRILRDPQRRGRMPIQEDSVVVHYQFSRDTRYDREPMGRLSKPNKLQKKPVPKPKPKKPAGNVRKKILEEKRKKSRFKRRKATPRALGKGKKVDNPRIPDSVKSALRRKRILQDRAKKSSEEKERRRMQQAIKLAAGRRTRLDRLELLHREMAEKEIPVSMCCGGVAGHPPTSLQVLRALEAMRGLGSASDFDGILTENDTVVVLGNSPTMKELSPEVLKKVPTIGCNRGLRWADFWPDFLCIGDREPYCQERDDGRLCKAARSGVRLVIADSVFDPQVLLRGPYEEKMRRAQPPPKFEVYLYRIGPRKKRWNYGHVVDGSVNLPVNTKTFEAPVVSCLNIAGSMLQAAAIMGAKRIIVSGIEMRWKSEEKSHFFGSGREVGAYPQDGALKMIMAALRQVKAEFSRQGIEVLNISPVQGSPFARVFGHYPKEKFLAEVKHLPSWNPCYVLKRAPRNGQEEEAFISAMLGTAE
jgi:hypothetical protein